MPEMEINNSHHSSQGTTEDFDDLTYEIIDPMIGQLEKLAPALTDDQLNIFLEEIRVRGLQTLIRGSIGAENILIGHTTMRSPAKKTWSWKKMALAGVGVACVTSAGYYISKRFWG